MNAAFGRWILSFCILLCCAGAARAQQADRSKLPELAPPPSLKLPPIQHLKLSNGLSVILMEKHDLPLLEMELVVRAGSAMDPDGKSGLASMMAAMMDEGAGSRSSLELADAIDYLGASLSPYASQHTSGVSLHVPVVRFDSALALMADMALRPTFPADELARQQKQRLTTLLQWHDEPRSIASVLYGRTLFGVQHPYGRPTIGNESSIRSFKRDDLVAFHRKYFSPGNSTVIVVGDITAAAAVPKLEQAFGAWKRDRPAPVTWPAAEQVRATKIFLADKPGAAQSEIRIGRIGVQRLTEDYFALAVLNTILGGSFTSRLNQNLREVHGYSYGASSSFDMRPLPGPFTAGAAVQTDVTDKALAEFMKELTAIMDPVTDAELMRAKNYVALGYPSNFQSVGEIAGQLGELAIYDLPDTYFNAYIQNVLAVTKDDVHRVAQKYLDPKRVDIIIVGDRSKIEAGIRALNIAPVETFTIDDVLGKAPVLDDK